MADDMVGRIAWLSRGLPPGAPHLLDGIRYGIGLARKYPNQAEAFADDIDRQLSVLRDNEPLEMLEVRIQTILDYIVNGNDAVTP